MFKIFITVLALSDTGAISTSVETQNFESWQACTQFALTANTPTPKTITMGTHTATVSVKAQCVPDDAVVRRGDPGAEIIGDMFSTIGRSMQRIR